MIEENPNDNIEEIEGEEIHAPKTFDQILEEEKDERRKLSKKLKEEFGEYVPIVVTNDGVLKTANDLTEEEQTIEFLKCAYDPIHFIETYLTVFDQTKGDSGEIVPFKLFNFQKRLIDDYQEHRFNVANKYRQAGISTTTCAYLAWYIMFQENRAVAIVANKLETAQNELMSDVVDFIESCPAFLRPKPSRKDTEKLKRYDNGSEIGAFSAAKGLRGMTPTLLFWDETAWTDKGDKFWEAAGPTLQTGGRAIFVSTPNGLDAVFYKYFNGARTKGKDGKKMNNFNAVELWWFNDPRYTCNQETKKLDLEWVKNKNRDDEIRIKDEHWSDEKRIQLMDDGWEATSSWFEEQVLNANGDMRKVSQELLCSFLGSGDNFIPQETIKDIEDNYVMTPIRDEYLDKAMWIFEDVEELEDYIMTIDVATGHGDDYSAINILRMTEVIKERVVKSHGRKKKMKIRTHQAVQVAEYYGRVTPQELAEIAYMYGTRYNNAYCVVDVTGGVGAQTVDKLFELGYDAESMHYSEINHKPTRAKLSAYIKTTTKTLPDGSQSKVDLVPGFFIGGNRGSVLTEMERAIRMKEIDVRSTRLLAEFKTFVTVSGSRVADHKRSYHDDSIMSLAIGIYAMNFEMKKFNMSPTKTKKMLDSMMVLSSNDEIVEEKDGKMVTKKKHVVRKRNPYGDHSWLFAGLNKKR